MLQKHSWYRDSFLFLPLVVLVLLVCIGCGGDGGGTSHRPPPAITSFAAAENPVTAGTSTTLTAVFTGGTGVVSNGVGAVTSGVPVSTGNLTTNTTFILTVTNGAGVAATFSVSVNVVPGPAITTFTAAKNQITVGSGTSLSYTFTGANGSIDQGIGNVVSGATSEITPATTTIYTLTVTDSAGSAVSKSLTVNVVPAPRIASFSASPAAVAPGGTATLNAVFENGVGFVDQGIGTITNGTGITTSALAVTTAFMLTVTNPAGDSVTATTTVTATNFSATGSMGTSREGHTATLLPSGKVLIVGGSDGTRSLNSAELYDPATGTFATTAASGMQQITSATLLKNGHVLVIGEIRDALGTRQPAAELYDPSAGSFSPTGSPLPNTSFTLAHTATLLQSGKVLVVFGDFPCEGGGTNPTEELYDPVTGTFSPTGSSADKIAGHTATLLPDGKVLVAGGDPRCWSPLGGQARLYDPITGAFVGAGFTLEQRVHHTATLLPSGKVLITGGCDTVGWSRCRLFAAELFVPSSGSFIATGQMNIDDEMGQTATLLIDGTVLIVGGDSTSSTGEATNPEIYDPSTEQFKETGPLLTARRGHTATLLQDGKVLITGGRNPRQNVVLSSAELYE
jgi:hypothetical protein